MSVSKLITVGGSTLTGIGGVIATSSLISKSATEKSEERLSTKALADTDPHIKDYKDQNESEQGREGEGQNSGEDQGTMESGEQKSAEGQAGEEGIAEDTPTGSEDPGSSSSEESEEEGGDSGGEDVDESTEDGEENSQSNGVTKDGSTEAEHSHAAGNKYGTKDMRMTKQELEKTMQMKSGLESFLEQLRNI
ncbi:hypothetical protein MHC_04075 [Mycoplasma haemocanis str. Illinois]|uniref:Uncharacterized protein n=1 Tax=Mycoplasma haemocanis (strain Illinois) TaxID=1111676 RepID=H6N7P9_MYCHN|nr:hypothetical protein [Mycoplasma haemocanis]AEW45671.1 hypothetical protein MHC_04075 [Mycoplasma haemocanis str. Illinois]